MGESYDAAPNREHRDPLGEITRQLTRIADGQQAQLRASSATVDALAILLTQLIKQEAAVKPIFITLHLLHDAPIALNTRAILTFCDSDDDYIRCTPIELTNGLIYRVTETPAEIVALIAGMP